MKTKVLISCAVTAQVICTFVFAKAIILFSHNMAQMPVDSDEKLISNPGSQHERIDSQRLALFKAYSGKQL